MTIECSGRKREGLKTLIKMFARKGLMNRGNRQRRNRLPRPGNISFHRNFNSPRDGELCLGKVKWNVPILGRHSRVVGKGERSRKPDIPEEARNAGHSGYLRRRQALWAGETRRSNPGSTWIVKTAGDWRIYRLPVPMAC